MSDQPFDENDEEVKDDMDASAFTQSDADRLLNWGQLGA